MKKKILSLVFVLFLAVTCVFGLAACGDKNKDDNKTTHEEVGDKNNDEDKVTYEEVAETSKASYLSKSKFKVKTSFYTANNVEVETTYVTEGKGYRICSDGSQSWFLPNADKTKLYEYLIDANGDRETVSIGQANFNMDSLIRLYLFDISPWDDNPRAYYCTDITVNRDGSVKANLRRVGSESERYEAYFDVNYDLKKIIYHDVDNPVTEFVELEFSYDFENSIPAIPSDFERM